MTRNQTPLEFSRPLRVDRVPRGGCFEKIAADPRECRDLAVRLGVPRVHSLTAKLQASPCRGGGLKLEGKLSADLDQVSVVSLENFRQTVEYPVLRYFLPPGAAVPEDFEADTFEAGHVDLGEVVTETLALELEPYPRKPGEVFDVLPDEPDDALKPASPFAGLAGLKRT